MDEENFRAPSVLLDLVERVTSLEFELKSIRVEQDEAKISRRELHKKLDAMKEQNHRSDDSVRALTIEIRTMKPTLTLHEELRHQLRGAFWVMAFIWSTMLVGVGFLLKQLTTWLSGR